jgi:hypothetical protein
MSAVIEHSSLPQLTRAEQETETAAKRLVGQVDGALVAVAARHSNEPEELEAITDRIERAARDLVTALRELSEERRAAEAEDAE